MAYKISGRVLHIGSPVTLPSKSGTPYTIAYIVITVRKFDPYTGQPTDDTDNTPKFQFIGDKCQQLANVKIGDIVTVHFDIQGRSFVKDNKTEYFTGVRPFRIDVQQQTYHQQVPQNPYSGPYYGAHQPTTPPMAQNTPQEAPIPSKDKNDDLPF